MAQPGDGKLPAAENTEVATTSGATDTPENRAGEAVSTKNEPSSPNGKDAETTGESQKPKSQRAKEPKLGTAQERLEMLQEAAKNFQKAGGHFRTGWTDKSGVPTIILAIPGAIIQDNVWFLAEEPKSQKEKP